MQAVNLNINTGVRNCNFNDTDPHNFACPYRNVIVWTTR